MKLLNMVPGTLCNQKLWQGLATQLGEHQLAHVPVERATTGAGILESISKAVQTSGHLCGFSMGGYYAMAHAVDNEKLDSLVVLGSGCSPLGAREIGQRKKAIRFIEGMRDGQFTMPEKRLADFVDPQSPSYAKVTKVIREMEADLGHQVLVNQMQASLTREDLTDRLGQITCPVLVVAGEKDRLMDVKVLESMAAKMPKGEFHVLPGVSHMLPLEASEQVALVMSDFLERV